jgi:hypothetical protein
LSPENIALVAPPGQDPPAAEHWYERVTNQSIIIWTLKTKSLLTSLYKREELPLFGKEGRGEIF